jgi:isoleucyl-tRNA synthetase
LTNWYIRRSRRRFWKSQDDDDKAQAYQTLNYVLLQLSKIAAPFVPFISESIYQNLRTDDMPESVHLCEFPKADAANRDEELEAEMAQVTTVVKLGRQLRSAHDLKVRQPLSILHIVSRNKDNLRRIEALGDIILDELNVKKLDFGKHETTLAHLKAKPDFKKLGPRLGPKVKKAAPVIAAMSDEELEALAEGGKVSVKVDGEDVELSHDDVVIERLPKAGLVVASEGQLVIALETKLTSELVQEGIAREIVNRLQNKRKNDGLEVSDRIRRWYHTDDEVRAAEDKACDYINAETLCVQSQFVSAKPTDLTGWEEMDINSHPYLAKIEKA